MKNKVNSKLQKLKSQKMQSLITAFPTGLKRKVLSSSPGTPDEGVVTQDDKRINANKTPPGVVDNVTPSDEEVGVEISPPESDGGVKPSVDIRLGGLGSPRPGSSVVGDMDF